MTLTVVTSTVPKLICFSPFNPLQVDWTRFTWGTLKDSFYELLSPTEEANKT